MELLDDKTKGDINLTTNINISTSQSSNSLNKSLKSLGSSSIESPRRKSVSPNKKGAKKLSASQKIPNSGTSGLSKTMPKKYKIIGKAVMRIESIVNLWNQ